MARMGSTLVLNSETKWNKSAASKSSNDLSSPSLLAKKPSKPGEVANLDTFRMLLEAGGIGKTQGVDWATYENQLAELHSMVVSERAKSMSEKNRPVSGPCLPANMGVNSNPLSKSNLNSNSSDTKGSNKVKSKSILDKISPVKLGSRSRSRPSSPPHSHENPSKTKLPMTLNGVTPHKKFVSGPLISPSSQKDAFLPKPNTPMKPHEQLLIWHKQLQQMQEERDANERGKQERDVRDAVEREEKEAQKNRRSKSVPLEPYERSQDLTRQESSGSFSAKTVSETSPMSKATKSGNASPQTGIGFPSPRIAPSETDSIPTMETEFEYSDTENSKPKGSEDKGGHPKGWLGRVFSKRRDKSPGSSAESSPQRALKSILAFQHDLSSEFFKKGKSGKKQEIMRSKSEETTKIEGEWKKLGYGKAVPELSRGWSADLVAEVAVLEEDVEGLTQEDKTYKNRTQAIKSKNVKSDTYTNLSSSKNENTSRSASLRSSSDTPPERNRKSSPNPGLASPAYSKDFLEHISKLTESIQKKKLQANLNPHQLNCRGGSTNPDVGDPNSGEFVPSNSVPHRHNLSWPSPEIAPSWSTTMSESAAPYESLIPKSAPTLSTKPQLPKPGGLSRSGRSANWASELARLPPMLPNSNSIPEEPSMQPWKTSSLGMSQPLSSSRSNLPPLRRTQSQELNMNSLPVHFDPEPRPQVRGTQKWYSAELDSSIVKSHMESPWMNSSPISRSSGRGDFQPLQPFTTSFASSSSSLPNPPGGSMLPREERILREEDWYSDSVIHNSYRHSNMMDWMNGLSSSLDQTNRIHELNKPEPTFGYSMRDRAEGAVKMNYSGRLERTMSAEVWDNEVHPINNAPYNSPSHDRPYESYSRNYSRYSVPSKMERRSVSSGPDLQSFPRSFSSDERYQPPGLQPFRPQPNRQVFQYPRDPEPISNRYPTRFSGRLDSEYVHTKVENAGLRREVMEEYEGDSARMFLQDVTVLQHISPGSFVEKYALQPEDIRFGRFSVLKPCICRSNGQRSAVKLIRKHDLLKWQDIENVRSEVTALKLLRKHPNVVHLHDCYEDDQTVHLVMDHCDGGDLANRIKSRGRFSERKAAIICTRIISVLRHCQEVRVMHRDLRPENILIINENDDTQIKIADFGIAGFLKHGSLCTDVIGVSIYSAPEILHGPYGLECDIWSAGVILYFLLSGVLPFHAGNRSEMQKAIGRLDVDLNWPPWNNISSMAKDLVRRMLTIDPRQRITASEILCHPWIVG